jgi:ABC-type Fe2+-enterobactin transport system substrate-binding protein
MQTVLMVMFGQDEVVRLNAQHAHLTTLTRTSIQARSPDLLLQHLPAVQDINLAQQT